jgi:hypothetical protein
MNTPLLQMTPKEGATLDRCYAVLTQGSKKQWYKAAERLTSVLGAIIARNVKGGRRVSAETPLTKTKMKVNETEFPMNVLIELMHGETAEQLRRDLNANRGFGNGTEAHINGCRICQRKLKTRQTAQGAR